MRKIFIITIFLCLFSTFASGQLIPDYIFLEVLDSNGKPIKDAAVQQGGYYFENNEKKEIWRDRKLTDNDGKARIEGDFRNSNRNESRFRIIKSDYFPFYDLGIPLTSHQIFAKIELLKIPTNDAERKILGDEQIKREFMLAVKNGEVEKVRNFIKSGVYPNLNTNDLRGIAGPKNVPAIIFAATAGNNEMLELLLKSKVKLNQKDEQIRNILYYYFSASRFSPDNLKDEKLRSEFEAGVKFLIDNDAAYKNVSFPNNTNALLLSVQKGNLNLVKYFLKKGFSINAQDDFGQTVLFYAPREMFEFLLDSGADPNILRERDKTSCGSILMHIVFWGDINLINTLLAHKANVNLTCPNGYNALKAAQERKNYGYMNDTDKIINILKTAGAK